MKVLFVCMGNICRSPTAEGIFRDLVKKENLQNHIHIDSAGTGGWHAGEPPDPRSVACAQKFGIDISDLRARQFVNSDFKFFDFIVVMDSSNEDHCLSMANSSEYKAKVKKLLTFIPNSRVREVPDPYSGGLKGFEMVYKLIEEGCLELLNVVRSSLK